MPLSFTFSFAFRLFQMLAVAGFLACGQGCAHKKYGAVRFESEPAGAEVLNLKDDATLGLTPVLVVWESDNGEPEYLTVLLRKKGFRDEAFSFWLNTRHETREAAQDDPQPFMRTLTAREK